MTRTWFFDFTRHSRVGPLYTPTVPFASAYPYLRAGGAATLTGTGADKRVRALTASAEWASGQ